MAESKQVPQYVHLTIRFIKYGISTGSIANQLAEESPDIDKILIDGDLLPELRMKSELLLNL